MTAAFSSCFKVLFCLSLVAGCSREQRVVDVGPPQTPPRGPSDRRIPLYQDNAYQVSQGGRYFSWYGCAGCHGNGATGQADLTSGRWVHGGQFDQVYRYVESGHEGRQSFNGAIPAEQLWQITAYVRELPATELDKRRRQDLDGSGEPQGTKWSGPVK